VAGADMEDGGDGTNGEGCWQIIEPYSFSNDPFVRRLKIY
jgi:hypothetical protein